jgi:hypothetical protein
MLGATSSVRSLPSPRASLRTRINWQAKRLPPLAGVTFPTSVASPTNITAGTITTATNVTTLTGGAITGASFATSTGMNAFGFAGSAGTSNTVTFATDLQSPSSVDDFYLGSRLNISVGIGAGQSRIITAYNGTTKVATVAPNFTTTPTGSLTVQVLPWANPTGVQGSVTGSVASVTGNVGGNVVGTVASVTGAVGSVTGNVGGNVTGSVGSIASGGITTASFAAGAINAAAIGSDAITDAKVAADVTIASVTGAVGSVTGAVGSVTGNVGGNVTGSVGSIATGGIAAASFTAGAIDSTAIAADAIGSSELAASAASEIASAVRTELTAELASVLRVETVTDKVGDMVEADSSPANYRFTSHALAQTWDVARSVHTTTGSFGEGVASVQGSVTGSVASVSGAVGSVTGNVGGNVVGSVASVTARVTANTDQLAGQTVTAGAGVTFPASVASPTNITAGTITTVTNLTNAPTAGDLTATMKASVTTAATAATPTAAAVTGSVGSVATGGISSGSFASGAIDSTAIATDAIGSAELAASAGTEIATAVRSELAAELAAILLAKTVTDKLGDLVEADSSPANYRLTAHALANAPTGGSAPTAAAVASAVRTELTPELSSVTRIETVTDKIGDMTEADSSPANYRFTTHALANAPSGGTAPTVTQIADEVQTRTIAAVTTVGSVTGNVGGNVVGSVASVSGNVGGNVTGSIGSLAAQAKADVNAEADTALADVGVTTTVTGRIDAGISTRLASASYTAPDNTAVGSIKTVTDKLNDTLEADSSPANYRFTAHALAQTSGALTPTLIANQVWASVLEGSYTAEDMVRFAAAVAVGKTTIIPLSGDAATVTFRDASDASDIVVADMTGSERASVTLTP